MKIIVILIDVAQKICSSDGTNLLTKLSTGKLSVIKPFSAECSDY